MKENEAIASRGRPGPTRCPFCHEECASAKDACACAECLARHHRGCWDESRGCASCRGTRLLELAKQPAEAPPYGAALDSWLKLGVLYNSGLALVTVLTLLARGRILDPLVWIQVAIGAVLANICFVTGPGIELVALRLGYRGHLLRAILFLVGWLLAGLLAGLCCFLV